MSEENTVACEASSGETFDQVLISLQPIRANEHAISELLCKDLGWEKHVRVVKLVLKSIPTEEGDGDAFTFEEHLTPHMHFCIATDSFEADEAPHRRYFSNRIYALYSIQQNEENLFGLRKRSFEAALASFVGKASYEVWAGSPVGCSFNEFIANVNGAEAARDAAFRVRFGGPTKPMGHHDSDLLFLLERTPKNILSEFWQCLSQQQDPELTRLELTDRRIFKEGLGLADLILRVAEVDAKTVHECYWSSVKFWQLTRQLQRASELYKSGDEDKERRHLREIAIFGLINDISNLVDKTPQLWTHLLPEILIREEMVVSLGLPITLAIHNKIPKKVESVLVEQIEKLEFPACEFARGILAKCRGGISETTESAKQLITSGLRKLDGDVVIPHPLKLKSSLWFGSAETEQMLMESIEKLEMEFRSFYRDSKAVEEEQLTQRLLSELEIHFRKADVSIQSFAGDSDTYGQIEVSQRPVAKTSEEPIYHCDVLFLVEASLSKFMESRVCELIQVKKPQRGKGENEFRDVWRIETHQLNELVGFSQSSVYWLIGSNGEIWVCPAKLLIGIMVGQRKVNQASFTLHYSDIRSALIPLSQFLVQLLLGFWAGTADPAVLSFADGNLSGIRARNVFQVRIEQGDGGGSDGPPGGGGPPKNVSPIVARSPSQAT